ncbi:MAG: OmpH family outer membrane protein [Alphaproteobacteria bacterium]|nr:OmpH family outer membrane protein [Alphaproteobacteria bacterium]
MATENNSIVKKYTKMGIIATSVVVVALAGALLISNINKGSSLSSALKEVSTQSANMNDLHIAVISMDKIQLESNVLKDLHKQRAAYEEKLKAKLEKEQKALEKEKKDIEQSQGVLAPEAIQRRVADYQRRVATFQRDLAESAQSLEAAYQEAVATIQKQHLDPVVEGVIAKKNLSLVMDGRMLRLGKNVENLDITDEVIKALNKKVSSVKMSKPKGF